MTWQNKASGAAQALPAIPALASFRELVHRRAMEADLANLRADLYWLSGFFVALDSVGDKRADAVGQAYDMLEQALDEAEGDDDAEGV